MSLESSSAKDRAAALYEQALTLHRQGRIEDARRLYRDVLSLDPDHADALHLLGIVAAQSKDPAQAVELIGRAVALRPDSGKFHYNLGVALQELGRREDALAAYDRVIALEPANAEAHNNRGVVLQESGRYEDALAAHRAALALDPKYVEAQRNLGNALKELGRLEEALAAYRAWADLAPRAAEAHNNLGVALKELGRTADALAAFGRALALKPDYAEAHNNHGNALCATGQPANALACFDRALALRPDYAEAHNNLGSALWDLGRAADALVEFERALALKPGYVEAINNRGNALADLGHFEDSLAAYESVLALDPENINALWNLTLGRLLQGDFARGWEGYELRQRLKLKLGANKAPALTDVAEIEGKSILLYGEQGLGDEIMFASLVPDAMRHARRVTLECEPRLTGLLSRSLQGARVIGRGGAVPTDIDRTCLTGSLGRLFRKTREAFPGTPYLVADPVRVAAMKRRLAALGPGPKLGIMWRGGAGARREKMRSLSLADMAQAMDPAYHWVSLNHLPQAVDDVAQFTAETGRTVHHWPEITRSTDYDDTAALIAALDAVFTVTCTIGHCSGALGVPVHVLVPRAPEWRYGIAGDTIPWYRSMALYRQNADGSWPLARVGAALARVGAA